MVFMSSSKEKEKRNDDKYTKTKWNNILDTISIRICTPSTYFLGTIILIILCQNYLILNKQSTTRSTIFIACSTELMYPNVPPATSIGKHYIRWEMTISEINLANLSTLVGFPFFNSLGTISTFVISNGRYTLF